MRSTLYFLAFLSSFPVIPAVPQHQIHLAVQTPLFPASSHIRDILLDSSIIEEVLDDFTPTFSLEISYSQYQEAVLLGNDLPVQSVSKRPVFAFKTLALSQLEPTTTAASHFTLIMTDPDATSREDPALSEFCHWILTNLTTTAPVGPAITEAKDLKEGELEAYYPPAPPPKTGKHRYVFVLLEGSTSGIKAPKERPHWGYGKVRHGVRDWAKENGLTVVGANFFYALNEKQ